MQDILQFFENNFENFSWLAVFIVAMLPIAEAKVAIPFGMSTQIWGAHALSPIAAGTIGFVGSTLPAVFIILFLKPTFNYLKSTKVFNKIVIFFEKYLTKKNKNTSNDEVDTSLVNNKDNYATVDKSVEQKSKWQQILTLVVFCAIPLPLAGVWTSSAIAGLGNMKFWPSFLAVAFGNLIETVFVTVLSVLLIDSLLILVYATIVLLVVYVAISFIIYFYKQKSSIKA